VLKYIDLDDRTRRLMVQEIDRDIKNGSLYLSARLSAVGQADYPALLREATRDHDDGWLEAELRKDGRLNATERRRTPDGKRTIVDVPANAAETLAEGEFNRFYSRALCLRAREDSILQLTVYRAKSVDDPGREAETKVGQGVSPRALLKDLRANPRMDAALGLPTSENNAGLSVRLPTI